ncbi:MAG TPA: acetyl-CoA carboxylase carboxyl transferase subunit beta [Candidatus Borkfalkia faecigallinarum]|uniref:Acetyl-coenzyme A carboxylase carboxyl transferase subunit beta n=1 Tax=Candidatus Borkfalkia faecigallinarum TaxID=2838509 RepID=A0A9D1VUS8_9FIRM|nr:acetyl-CoA carboxylase carboxyl transferase subunit beta [Candidatus Borkfalkia faecigallinarum]
MNFEDLKKFFFRKPKNALEGSDEAAPAGARQPAQNGAAIPEKLAEKCEKCGQIILSDELRDNFGICPKCGHYKKLDARARIALCAENFIELFAEVEGGNPLDFPGYDEKLASLRSKTGEKDAVVCGTAFIGGVEVALFSMDHRFQMGSMGHAVGEKITAVFEYATERRLPVVGFVLSGGARMQEGIVSLMQMAKTSAAVAKHGEAGLLYIAVLTDPTTGGVSASFAFEADIILAEQGALIGFAGPRVIEQTIRQKLPAGFQRAEFLQTKGFVDRIVGRKEMPSLLASLLQLHAAPASEQTLAAEQTPASEQTPAAEQAPAADHGGAAAEKRAASVAPDGAPADKFAAAADPSAASVADKRAAGEETA